jgi:uncharacterized protein
MCRGPLGCKTSRKHADVLRHACLQNAKGKLILAGALIEPVDGGLLVFKGASVEEIESFVASDPYVQNGIVANSSVRPLATVCAP